ncbi:hypothetical protein EU538_04135 [Candidatus Thorarchaeota archaeon]|nr:MAG: hypothetical protein EU538_04135 [Candidatus Thorarchaeota archaeon]
MSEMTEKAVAILLGILRDVRTRGAPFKWTKQELQRRIQEDLLLDSSELASRAIESALDHWLVDKTIDNPRNENGEPIDAETWFLRLLTEKESESLRKLPDHKKAVIRLLREQETEEDLGCITEADLLSELENLGFEEEYVSRIEGKVSTFYGSESGEPIKWYYLIPQSELSDELD